MALVRILRSKKQSKPKPRSLAQGDQWRPYWRSRKLARRSSPSLQKSDCKKPAKVPVADIDGCSSSSSFTPLSPENTSAPPAYNPWGTTPEDLWAPTSNYYTFMSEYMTSAAAALPSPPDSPQYTPNSPESYVPCCCCPSATSTDYTPAKVLTCRPIED